jgi:four helix bundle protein
MSLKGERMKLEDLQVYQLSMSLGDRIWDIVVNWDYFAKDTIGKQLVKAADSVASNISEGYGRFHYKESKHFGYYARGSLYETKTWITKAHNRSLINDDDFHNFEEDIKMLGIKLNNYIRSIGKKSTVNQSS